MILLLGALFGPCPPQQPPRQPIAEQREALEELISEWLIAVQEAQDGTQQAAQARLHQAQARLSLVVERWGEESRHGRPVLSLVEDWEALLEAVRPPPGAGLEAATGLSLHPLGFHYFVAAPPAPPAGQALPLLIYVTSAAAEDLEQACAGLPAAFHRRCLILLPEFHGVTAEGMAEAGRVRLLLSIAAVLRGFPVDRNRLLLLDGGGPAAAARFAALLPHLFSGLAARPGTLSGAAGATGNLRLLPCAEHDSLEAAAAWLLEQPPRDAYPLAFQASFTLPAAGRIFWVQALQFDPSGPGAEPARLAVRVDQATNTIHLEATRVNQVSLFLNDRIIDLERPVTIERNGRPLRVQLQRSLRTLLENYALNLDARAVFPAMIRKLDLPPAAP